MASQLPSSPWRIVAVAALAMVGTLPGRTQGLGLITESLLVDFGLDRVTYAELNFWATIVGALGAIGVGRLIDRFGARAVLTTVALGLGVTVSVMSQVTTVLALAAALLLTRTVGQSALSVVSIAMVGQWFVGRLNIAMAAYSIALSVGFMVAFPVVGSLIQTWGWRGAWLAIGLALVVVLAPLGWMVVRRPVVSAAEGGTSDLTGHAWTEAIGTPAFWVFALGTALYGLVASGIGLFNESILLERGFGPAVYYRTLIMTALTALAGNFFGGWLAMRAPPTRLMAASLFVLAAGLVALPHVSSIGGVMTWAAAMGLGGGLVMVLFFSVWPAVFGRRHLGQIQGAAQALTVLASAIGPLLLAWCVDLTGSYAAMFRILAAVIAGTAVTALVVELPRSSIATVAASEPRGLAS